MPALSHLSAPARSFQDVYFSSTQVMAARELGRGRRPVFGGKRLATTPKATITMMWAALLFTKMQSRFLSTPPRGLLRQTFSDQRYEIWNNQSCFHNIPTIGGKDQPAGAGFSASCVSYEAKEDETRFSLDIKNAYENKDEIQKWKRTFTLSRKNKEITITEDFAFNAP